MLTAAAIKPVLTLSVQRINDSGRLVRRFVLLLTAVVVASCDSSANYKTVAWLHAVPPSRVHDEREGERHPDCDFLTSPIGTKACHYEVEEQIYWHVRYQGREYEELLERARENWDSPGRVSADRLCAEETNCAIGQWMPVERTALEPGQPDRSPFPAEVWLHWRKIND